ncbi:acyl-CoA N-acyltransferase [Coniophora puteana RWD-64-598 SS2]|uniref:Glucosamine 6-phosphate N-acetyltransferase n=1 Tax=Coniophora puteana (strain RWD-64-598) TaxID=741705 RepID=A0A5M3M9R2_CONPW|nr:acyl-CoA N-acyltransferase [Coniophora puteana RWD-64-598 SS2]EIW75594.1 acyl-CoA N-acyltransferase [Coniophora puteana RWD-64-598 SS2]
MSASIESSSAAPLDLMFSQDLVDPEVVQMLPPELAIRPLASDDYKRGHLDVLRVLTKAADPGAAAWTAHFLEMRACADTYFPLVIVDKKADRIVASGTLYVERTFSRGLGSRAHPEDIAVDRTKQGRYLGLLLCQALMYIGGRMGVYKTVGNCTDANMPFYLKFGCHRAGRQMVRYTEGAQQPQEPSTSPPAARL